MDPNGSMVDKQFKELRKRKLANETDQNLPLHLKYYTICCVCGKSNQRYKMTMAPKQKQMIFRWSQVFGQRFLKTCTKSQVNQYICAIHWVQLRDDWEGPLPEVLEKMKEVHNGSFKDVMVLNGIDKEGNWSSETSEKCRYCSDVRARCEMVLVPMDQTTLARWIEKLGPSFPENLNINSTNYICWRHFNLPNLLRSSYLKYLPKPMDCPDRQFLSPVFKVAPMVSDNNRERIQLSLEKNCQLKSQNIEPEIVIKEEEEELMVFEQCRYCDEILQIEKMVLVPKEKYILASWIKALGSTFFNKLTTDSSNYICWSHFDLPDSIKPHYLECLPKKSISTGNTIPHCQFGVVKRKESIDRRIETPYYRYIDKNVKDNEEAVKCVYCGSVRSRSDMSLVPEDPTKLIRLIGKLGLKFFDNLTMSSSNYICWNHIEFPNNSNLPMIRTCRPRIEMAYPRLPNRRKVKVEETRKMSNNEDGSEKLIEDVKPEIVIKQEEPMKPKTEELNKQPTKNAPMYYPHPVIQCCVCGETKHKYDMTLAPNQKDLLAKWSLVYGPDFLKNCENDKVNHYICTIHWKHLRDDWKGPLPEVLEKMKRINNGSFEVTMFLNGFDIQKATKYICRYCGVKSIGSNMTYVPENTGQFFKWVEILGEQFRENCGTYRNNRICWSHFKYRDEARRTTDNLPMTNEMMNEEMERNVLCKSEKLQVEIWIEEAENEEKPDIETLQDIVKTEEEDDQHPDYSEKNTVVVEPSTSCSVSILFDEEEKPLLFIKEE